MQQDGKSNTALAYFYQDVSIAGGTTLNLTFKAGTYVASDVAKFGMIFFNGNTRLDSSLVEVDFYLGSQFGPGYMGDYSNTATAPATANKVRIIGKTGADWLKVDQVCLTASSLPPASLGDYAWYDLNRNGIQDNIIDPLDGSVVGPELPAPGLIIELHKASDDALVAKDTTDVNGLYLFTGLAPGDYYIKLDVASLPTGFIVSPTDALGNTIDAKDNDIMHGTYRSASTNLVAGEDDRTWDIGINHSGSPDITDPCGCVEEYIYMPDNQNYIYSEEVAVEATPGGIWRIIAINNSTGNTTYGIMQDGPSADFAPEVLVPQPIGVALTVVSPGVFHYDFYHQEPLGYGIVVTDGIDTLEYQSACNSVQEEFDQTLKSVCAFGATLNLQTVFPEGTVTYYFLQNGAFHFIDNFDEYMAQFIAAGQNPPITTLNPLDYSPGDTIALYMRWLPNGNVGVPGTGLCPKTLVLNVAVEADVTDCAAGIGNFVWNDQDADGQQDAGEPGIPGVLVTLTNVGTNAMQDTLTDANGRYFFGSIPPGTYQVTFGTPAGYNPTTANAVGVLDGVDSDAGAGGMTGNYVLVGGQVDSTVDAGFYTCPTLSLRDTGVCGTFSINLNANIPTLLQGGTWYNDGIPVDDPTAVNWDGMFIYQKNSGACMVTDTMVIYRDVPDYTSRVTIYPNVVVGPSPVDVVITVAEENDKPSCLPLYVGIPVVLERFAVTYNPNLTNLSGQSLNNNEFNYIGIIDGYHFWQYVGNGGIFPANGLKKFGISGIYNNLGTTGYTTFSCFVTLGSGGEINYINNFSGTTLFFFN